MSEVTTLKDLKNKDKMESFFKSGGDLLNVEIFPNIRQFLNGLIPDNISKYELFRLQLMIVLLRHNFKEKSTTTKTLKYIKEVIVSIQKLAFLLNKNQSGFFLAQIASIAVKDKEDIDIICNKELFALLSTYESVYKKMLEIAERCKKNTISMIRNEYLTDLANVLVNEYGFKINEARLRSAQVLQMFAIDVPGMGEDVDPLDRRRILQSIMPKVTKSKKKN